MERKIQKVHHTFFIFNLKYKHLFYIKKDIGSGSGSKSPESYLQKPQSESNSPQKDKKPEKTKEKNEKEEGKTTGNKKGFFLKKKKSTHSFHILRGK